MTGKDETEDGGSAEHLLHELEARMQAAPDPLAALAGLLGSRSERSATFAKQGAMVAGYRLDGVLGVGGMGVTYVGVDASGAPAAIKVVEAMADHARERFARECSILQALEHPAIVRYRGHGAFADGCAWLLMDLVPGTDLEALLDDLQADAPRLQASATLLAETTARGAALLQDPSYHRRILRLLATVADALEVVHDRGIVHRDLKPANLLVTDALDPVVIDFGLSRDAFQKVSLTRSGIALGTLAYMAPEQLDRDPGQVDHRADVYALGLVLYRALVGCDLRGETRDIVLRHRRPFVLAASVARTLPVPIQAILYRCLDPRPGRRYPTAAALAADLRAAAGKEAVQARRPGILTRHLRRRAGVVTRAAVAAGVVTAALWAVWPPTRYRVNVVVATKELRTMTLSDGTLIDHHVDRRALEPGPGHTLHVVTRSGVTVGHPFDLTRDEQWVIVPVRPGFPSDPNHHHNRVYPGEDAALVQITSSGTLAQDDWFVDGKPLEREPLFVWLEPGRHSFAVEAYGVGTPKPQRLFREEVLDVELKANTVTDIQLAPRVLLDVPGEVRCTWATVLSPKPQGLDLELAGAEIFMRSAIQLSIFDFGWSSLCAVTAPHADRPALATLVYEPPLADGPLRSAVVWLRSEWSELGRVQVEFRCRTTTGGGEWVEWPKGNAALLPRLELEAPDGFTAFEVRARMAQPQAPGDDASVRHLAGTFCGGHILTDPGCFAFAGSPDAARARLPDGVGEWKPAGSTRWRAHAARLEPVAALPAASDLEPTLLLEGRPEGPRLGSSLARIGDLDGDGAPEIAVADLSARDLLSKHLWILDGRTGRPVRSHAGGPLATWRAVVLGDGDGDGTPDYLITDSDASDSQYRAGAAWRVSGKTGVLDAILRLPPQGVDRHGDLGFGGTMMAAGDLDGDGFGDAWVSAPNWDGEVDDVGCVRVVRGAFALTGADRLLDRVVVGRSVSDKIAVVAAGRDVDGDGVPDLVTWRRGSEYNLAHGTLEVHPGRAGAFAPRATMLECGSTVAAGFGADAQTGRTWVVALAVERTRATLRVGDEREPGFVTAIDTQDGKRPWTKSLGAGLWPLGSLVAIGDRNGDGCDDFALGVAEDRGPRPRGGVLFLSGKDGAFLGHAPGPPGDSLFGHGLAFWQGDPDTLLVGSQRAAEACGSLYRCRLPRW